MIGAHLGSKLGIIWVSKCPELASAHGFGKAEVVSADQVDVVEAEGREMGDILGVHLEAALA